MYNTQQLVEIFHILFLRSLQGKLEKSLYALKGGCNLRFFFKSIRYSEDIDLDVAIVYKNTLQTKVNKILSNPAFKAMLLTKGVEMVHFSTPKQTETTQRWKCQLRTMDSHTSIPTKIEFSRRQLESGIVYEPIDPTLMRTYQLSSTLSNHYVATTAFLQKIQALIHRTETQTRDVFDLKFLLDFGIDYSSICLSSIEASKAINHVMNMHFSDFQGQVLAYLMTEYYEYYNSATAWEKIQIQVINALEKLSS